MTVLVRLKRSASFDVHGPVLEARRRSLPHLAGWLPWYNIVCRVRPDGQLIPVGLSKVHIAVSALPLVLGFAMAGSMI